MKRFGRKLFRLAVAVLILFVLINGISWIQEYNRDKNVVEIPLLEKEDNLISIDISDLSEEERNNLLIGDFMYEEELFNEESTEQ